MKRNERENKESECVGVENVSRDKVTGSAGVKSTLAAPLSGTGRLTQWVFLRRGHCHPNIRGRAGCIDMGRKKTRISEKQYHLHGQTRHGKGKKPSYKAQIKESNIHGHSGTRCCNGMVGCYCLLPHPTSNPKCTVTPVCIF